MKIYFAFLVAFLLLAVNAQAIVINEFMPNPPDAYDRSEWVELTSYVNSSLENITLDTGNGLINLNGSIQTNEFIIITKNATAFSLLWDSEIRIFESSKVKLNNNGDNITLYNNSEVLDSIEYNESESNKSYGLCNQVLIPQNISTPGLPNICPSEETNETNATNETVTNGTCDLSLEISSDLILISDEKQNYYLVLEDKNCDQEEKEVDIEYWIEDLFGEMIKSEYTTTQSITCSKNTSRQWTPKGIEDSEAFYIKANITNSTCNDSDLSNGYAEKLIVVKGEKSGPYECPPCETKETACYCGSCPKCESEEEAEKEEEAKEFEILSCPEEVRKNEEIEIRMEVKNPSSNQRDYTVYSYVYEGNKILSLGFYGNFWLNTWDANKQNVSIPGNSSKTLTLKNRIAEDTTPGEYKLRVRIWLEGKKNDITKDITVSPEEKKELNITEENETIDIPDMENETNETVGLPTGRIISRRNENIFAEIVNQIINFFKNLFNL